MLMLPHIKDEVMLVGTLSMGLLIAESWFASWCVPEDKVFVPALSQEYCRSIYNNSVINATSKVSKKCPAGQTFFMDINAIHQVDFLIFWLAFTHIIYSVFVVLLSRYWAHELVKWEKQILSSGRDFVEGVAKKEIQKPANIFDEYFAAFKLQFTNFRAKGMDPFTAAILRQFYIISQKKDVKYRFFRIVKHELEQDFDEICGIDSVLWLFTAFSLFLEGQGSNSIISKIPMAGTLFVMFLSLVIGTNLMIVIQRLILDINTRMLVHSYTSPALLASKKVNTDEEKSSQARDSVSKEQMFEKLSPIKADMGLYGHGKFVWLWGIKFCMFEFSRKITYIIFYYQQFRNEDGFGRSCYHLSRSANGGVTVYLSLICCFVFCFYIGLKLIPLYSISTHVAMHQRKISYMQKLAKGVHNINAAHHLVHDSQHRHGDGSADNPVCPTCHASNIAQSKYVFSQPTSYTNMQSDGEHMAQDYLGETSEEESYEYDDDDILPDTMSG